MDLTIEQKIAESVNDLWDALESYGFTNEPLTQFVAAAVPTITMHYLYGA